MELTEPKTCMVCGQAKEEGIQIVSAFICHACETEIVKTEVEDARYAYFVKRMRQLWIRFHA
jgi:hypothetical protein